MLQGNLNRLNRSLVYISNSKLEVMLSLIFMLHRCIKNVRLVALFFLDGVLKLYESDCNNYSHSNIYIIHKK